jgi:hypothetical protein
MFSMRIATSLTALLLVATSSQAALPITDESGWSGQINIGAGFGQSESNMLAGLSSIDLGDERIDGLDEDAGSEDIGFPVLQFALNYTLGETQTQFYLRNQPSPYVALDMEVLGGIRQQVTGIGIVDVALSSSTVPTDVWKDPYLVGVDRGDTERTTAGLHIAWLNIMDSALSFEFSSKELEIDDEDSGESLGLSGRDRGLLDLTGEVYRFHLEYAWQISEHQRLVPAVSWLDYDLDGGAMAEDGAALKLTHYYQHKRWRFVSGIEYRGLESDEDNPIYGDSADKDVLSLGVTAFYEQPFGLENWTANARVSWYDADSDIDFYDESLAAFSLGMLYRFD